MVVRLRHNINDKLRVVSVSRQTRPSSQAKLYYLRRRRASASRYLGPNSGVMIIPETDVSMDVVRAGMRDFIQNYNNQMMMK